MHHWLVNLKPKEDGLPVMVVPIARKGDCSESDAVELLEWARLRWPGDVLDVVDPAGRSYLICSIPPWEKKALPPAP